MIYQLISEQFRGTKTFLREKGKSTDIFCKAKSIDVNTDNNTVEQKDALDKNKFQIVKQTNRN